MRICSLIPSATEILFALGLDDEIVGVTHECVVPPAAHAAQQAAAAKAVEQAIMALKDPSDVEGISNVMTGLASLEDPREQQRLQTLLDSRHRKYLGIEDLPRPAPMPAGATSSHDLALRIGQPHLGPQASAADLQARDELVTQINRLEGPLAREALLKRLADRERAAEQ